ncbi:MAG: HaeIII family restriction endonuclease [Candidatus Obscuribacterales bacterium]|nr:HaeIII family restriction endonuclease [Candidatus Obscuribacterales bacterium]
MAGQTRSGKAFEFAILKSFEAVLESNGPCQVLSDSAFRSAELEYLSLSKIQQSELNAAALPAVRHLMNFEPMLEYHSPLQLPLQLALQSDQSGIEGDVRDIVISNSANWQLGISAKHQHEAVKHSRISPKIDFGEKWLALPCSSAYHLEVLPVFERLAKLRENGTLWSELDDKDETVYEALLLAFRRELLRLDREHPSKVAAALASYLIGKQDFYKIMKFQQLNKIQVFNINGSLNNPSASKKPSVHLERLKLPRRIVEFEFKIDENGMKSKTTLELILDGGWQISFRIHNASSRVEPSLKFDIGLIGRPNSLPTFHVLW